MNFRPIPPLKTVFGAPEGLNTVFGGWDRPKIHFQPNCLFKYWFWYQNTRKEPVVGGVTRIFIFHGYYSPLLLILIVAVGYRLDFFQNHVTTGSFRVFWYQNQCLKRHFGWKWILGLSHPQKLYLGLLQALTTVTLSQFSQLLRQCFWCIHFLCFFINLILDSTDPCTWTRYVMVSWQRHYHWSTLTVVCWSIVGYLFFIYDRILTLIVVLSERQRIKSKPNLHLTEWVWLSNPPVPLNFHFISYHIISIWLYIGPVIGRFNWYHLFDLIVLLVAHNCHCTPNCTAQCANMIVTLHIYPAAIAKSLQECYQSCRTYSGKDQCF